MAITMDTDSSGVEMASDNGAIGSSVSPVNRIAVTGPISIAISRIAVTSPISIARSRIAITSPVAIPISWVAISIPIAVGRVAPTIG
jgi:hypothetical protein